MNMTQTQQSVIVGMGATGFSVARFFAHHNIPFKILDEDNHAARRQQFEQQYANVEIKTGQLTHEDFSNAKTVVVSPGIPSNTLVFTQLKNTGYALLSDIELFARAVKSEQAVVGITGTNGKSTVTCLLADMAECAGLRVAKGGNLSPPALDLLLDSPDADLYVLELSSFQLEMTYSLKLTAAVILNISQDHLDRYASFAEYVAAKKRIFMHAQTMVVNDLEDWAQEGSKRVIGFGLKPNKAEQFAVVLHQDEEWLGYGFEPWIACAELPALPGEIGKLNACAALALGMALDLPRAAMLKALRQFKNLPHRAERLGSVQGVEWVNDSKATNIASASAAVKMMNKPCIWLIGGDGKEADFSALASALKSNIRLVLLFGKSAQTIANSFLTHISASRLKVVSNLDEAIQQAMAVAQEGDCVLLAPACSSLDQYSSYVERGNHFKRLFEEFQCKTG